VDATPAWKPNDAVARRRFDRRHGKPTFFTVRYADDVVLFVVGSRQQTEAKREALAQFLWDEMRLELSAEKTLITPQVGGHHARHAPRWLRLPDRLRSTHHHEGRDRLLSDQARGRGRRRCRFCRMRPRPRSIALSTVDCGFNLAALNPRQRHMVPSEHGENGGHLQAHRPAQTNTSPLDGLENTIRR